MSVDWRRWLRWLSMPCLLFLCLLPTGNAAAASACPSTMESLAASTRIFGVPRGSLSADQVRQLPDSRFRPVEPGRLLSHAMKDWWLRISLHNDTAHACRRWLQVGPARLRDVRVYVRDGKRWRVMRAGTRYPLKEWALPGRQPVFPVTVPAHATLPVLARIVSRGEMVSVLPRLWRPGYFRDAQFDHGFSRGLLYGGIWLLVLTSLGLAWAYRRLPLALMAASVGFFTAYLATQANYAFVYLWPGLPGLNLWARIFLSASFYAAFYGYLFTIGRVWRLGAWWSRAFGVVLAVFALIAVFGGLLDRPSQVMIVALALDQLCRWGLAVAVVAGLWRKTLRTWYPLLLLGLLCAQSIHVYGHLLGLPISPPGGEGMYAPTTLVAGMFLLGTLANQMRKGHRKYRRTQIELDRQRTTEKQRLEQAVALRTDELKRTLNSRSRLLGHISHDLRSPLVGILDSARLWQRGDTRRDHARVIEQHARWQMDLIDELLDHSRSELLDLENNPVPGYLHAFLQEVIDQAELLAAHRHNRFEARLADDLPSRVQIDFNHLRRALLNLLGNAAKFTEHGCVRLAVQARSAASAGRAGLHFVVDDDGPGMAPADRERLVLPYARGESAAGREGVGLGLAIVSRLLERMGSKLLIDESPEGGSRFHFVIELDLATESAMEPMIDTGENLDVDGRGKVVLVVDDDRRWCEQAGDLLDGYGFDTATAASVAEALGILRARHVDMVVTEQCMDGMDGWELLRHIRESHPVLPVLLYSALPAQRPSGVAPALDFDAAVLKPASGAELVHLVASLAAASRADIAEADGEDR